MTPMPDRGAHIREDRANHQVKKKDLEAVVAHLRRVVEVLGTAKLHDSKIMSRYMEYLVALRLRKEGHAVQILDCRERSGADIFLPKKGREDGGIRVEVKSGRWWHRRDLPPWCSASFGSGAQITEQKFDQCVFVPYDDKGPREFLIFTKRDLKKVTRRRFAEFKTNPCQLLRCQDYDDLKHILKEWKDSMLDIERELHRHPARYRDQWKKIR